MQSKYETALKSAPSVYGRPENVLQDETLTHEQKREVLLSWEADAIHLQESAAEGFAGGERSELDEVMQALAALEKGD